jgi:hypothetical protein
MELEHQVVRSVRDAVDLFQNDIAFGLEVALAQQWAPHQIGKDFDGEGEVRVEYMGLITGVVAPGECIETTAADFQLESELLSGTALSALEDHVLEEMGDAELAAGFVRAGRADVNTHRGRTDPWQCLSENDQSVRCSGSM